MADTHVYTLSAGISAESELVQNITITANTKDLAMIKEMPDQNFSR